MRAFWPGFTLYEFGLDDFGIEFHLAVLDDAEHRLAGG